MEIVQARGDVERVSANLSSQGCHLSLLVSDRSHQQPIAMSQGADLRAHEICLVLFQAVEMDE